MARERPPARGSVENLVATLDEALDLLGDLPGGNGNAPVPARPANPASLLDECLELCAQRDARNAEPVRTLHHFACTGGTLISKCLSVMPNVQLLSEVDPLSTMLDTPRAKPRFAPTDMITLLRQSTRGVSREQILDVFRAELDRVYHLTVHSGLRLVLRDHAHEHYCRGAAVQQRPGLREIVARQFPVLSVLTVRHPLDSYLALADNGWIVFEPPGFDEYCRRYLAFLEDHSGLPVVRYEDFVASPRDCLREMCVHFQLPFMEDFEELFGAFALTGDSGRIGSRIAARPRRAVSEGIRREAESSGHFRQLRQHLRYAE